MSLFARPEVNGRSDLSWLWMRFGIPPEETLTIETKRGGASRGATTGSSLDGEGQDAGASFIWQVVEDASRATRTGSLVWPTSEASGHWTRFPPPQWTHDRRRSVCLRGPSCSQPTGWEGLGPPSAGTGGLTQGRGMALAPYVCIRGFVWWWSKGGLGSPFLCAVAPNAWPPLVVCVCRDRLVQTNPMMVSLPSPSLGRVCKRSARKPFYMQYYPYTI